MNNYATAVFFYVVCISFFFLNKQEKHFSIGLLTWLIKKIVWILYLLCLYYSGSLETKSFNISLLVHTAMIITKTIYFYAGIE